MLSDEELELYFELNEFYPLYNDIFAIYKVDKKYSNIKKDYVLVLKKIKPQILQKFTKSECFKFINEYIKQGE